MHWYSPVSYMCMQMYSVINICMQQTKNQYISLYTMCVNVYRQFKLRTGTELCFTCIIFLFSNIELYHTSYDTTVYCIIHNT